MGSGQLSLPSWGVVGTSGNPHIRGRRGWPVLAVVVLLVLAGVGCQSTPAGDSNASSSPMPTSSATATATPSASGTAWPKTFLRAAPGWRLVTMDSAWQKVLADGVVALSRRVPLVPLAAGHDGRTFFASVYSKTFSGVVRVDASTSRYTPIRRFPNAHNDQAGGAFDGRWLVWHEYHSLSGLDDFTTWSWDSRSGQVRQIGAARRAPSGDFWPSSWQLPDARDGLATWEQGSGPDGLGDVHVVELASGRNRIVRHGHPEASFFVAGGVVVWPESMKPDALTEMKAADAHTGRPVAPPPGLLKLRGGMAFATDGTAYAFPGPDWLSLHWSPSFDEAPQLLFSSRLGHPVDNSIQAAGRYIAFSVAPHLYLADTKTQRYVEISPGGWTCLDDKSLVISKPSKVKANHAVRDIVFLRLSVMPPTIPSP